MCEVKGGLSLGAAGGGGGGGGHKGQVYIHTERRLERGPALTRVLNPRIRGASGRCAPRPAPQLTAGSDRLLVY